ncbi:MAG TPA: hypothetical protein VGP55_03080 [Chitinophagaceae bacterium]|nr:hypothetical protein [Chitinophagaceae bacterium]
MKSAKYLALQQQLSKGWNTWSYGSMLTQVLLPEGLAVKVNFRQSFIGIPNDPSFFIGDAVVDKSELIKPIAHTVDGSYTELIVNKWHGNTIRVQSATNNNELFVLITPVINSPDIHYNIELEAGILWNGSGTVTKNKNFLLAKIERKSISIQSTNKTLDAYHTYLSPYLICKGDTTTAFYTGNKKSLKEIEALIARAKRKYEGDANAYGDLSEAFKGIETVLGWNTIYDAEQKRIITPVSRGWNKAWQGFVLFEWDTYFASYLFGLFNKDYAYSNAIAVTKGINKLGHIGHWQMPGHHAAEGMSQPPVGSMICWKLYDKYHDKWFLSEVYKELLTWNKWWFDNRMNHGKLSWGGWKNAEPQIAAWESGMDNSPMYEDIRMIHNGNSSLQNLWDVGLNSLYVNDCKNLKKMAMVLGKTSDLDELSRRELLITKSVEELWNENEGIFLNKYVDSANSYRLSPTLFYPMLAGIATKKQAEKMVKEHYYNNKEFYSDLIMPSISFNDKSFDNQYWRGSIWPPLNFMVYLGLRDYDPKAATILAEKSYMLFTKAWAEHNAVFENINSLKGVQDIKDQVNCDPFYHWGALMGIMQFLDKGKY